MTFDEANKREQMVFGRPYDPELYSRGGGVDRFEDMSVETAKELLSCGFIDPYDRQNDSPTAQEFIDFCDDGTDKWFLHGYVVSAERCDCRITIEGVGSETALTADERWLLSSSSDMRTSSTSKAMRGVGTTEGVVIRKTNIR